MFFKLIVLQGFAVGICSDFGQNFCIFFHAPKVVQTSLLAVPFIAEGLANAWYVDDSLDFLSFVGTVFAMTGVFKLHKGDRIRRQMIIRERLLMEEEELKRQQQMELELAEQQKSKTKPLEAIDEAEEDEYEQEKKIKKAIIKHDFINELFHEPNDEQ